jgi:gluconate 2-dehydrogenase
LKPKVLITRTLPEAVVAAARETFDVTLRDTHVPLSPEEAVQALKDYDGVVPTLGDPFNVETFAKVPAPRTKILANFGVGYNHIDVKAATAAGVAVSNTPGAVTDATADIAMTLILSTCRRASEGERILRAGKWVGWSPVQMLGMHVTGRTVGIIGLGRIGKAIAKRCHHGFDMKVVFHNRSKVADPGVPAEQLADALAVAKAADIVVVAVPGGAATHHLIGAEFFKAMGKHAVFVNISRGDVVDEQALIAALKAREIWAAGLDVYEFEPKVPSELVAMENTTLLPHLGTAALDVRVRMGLMSVANLKAMFAGEVPPNRVTP